MKVILTSYPLDYASGTVFIDDMKTNHLLNYPVEQVTYQDIDSTITILSGSITYYKAGGKGLKDQELVLETDSPVPLNSFKFSNRLLIGGLPPSGSASLFSPDNLYKQRLVYNSFDAIGNPLQYTRTDGTSTSNIWAYNGQYLIAQVKNAAQDQICHTSFETTEMGGWAYSGTPVISPASRTGRNYYDLATGNIVKSGLINGKNYIISYWSDNNPYTITGGSADGIVKSRTAIQGWTYFEHLIKATSSTLTINGTGSIDEVRLYPADSQMTTYTYDLLTGMTSSSDTNGVTTYFEHDGFQRLRSVKDQEGNVLKRYHYHYATENEE